MHRDIELHTLSPAMSDRWSSDGTNSIAAMALEWSPQKKLALEAFLYVLGEVCNARGLITGLPRRVIGLYGNAETIDATAEGLASNGMKLDLHKIVRKLYDNQLFDFLQPFFAKHGLHIILIPTAAMVGTYATVVVPRMVSHFRTASIKILMHQEAEYGQAVMKWAASNSINQSRGGAQRRLVVTEKVHGVGSDQQTSLQVIHSSNEVWTVLWKQREFWIRAVRPPTSSPTRSSRPRNYGSWDNSDNDYDNGDYQDEQQDPWMDGDAQQQRYQTDIDHVIVECAGSDCRPISGFIENCKTEITVTEGKELKIKITQLVARGDNYQGRGRHAPSEELPGRRLNSLDLPDELLSLVDDAIQFFDPRVERWYQNNGTPWRRGYLFYDPPGTGKTSFVKALASHLRLPVFTVDLAGMTDLEAMEHFKCLPENGCVVLLEDLDNAGLISNDMKDVQQTLKNNRQQKSYGSEAPAGVTISCLLNLIDGVGAKEGRLLIITTNRIASIDERITRCGRISHPFHFFGYSTKETTALTFKHMFGSFPIGEPPTGARLEKLAKAFAARCPLNFVTPSELGDYCDGYRGKPELAVAKFRDWIQMKRTKRNEPLYDMDTNTLEAVFSDDEDDEETEETEDTAKTKSSCTTRPDQVEGRDSPDFGVRDDDDSHAEHSIEQLPDGYVCEDGLPRDTLARANNSSHFYGDADATFGHTCGPISDFSSPYSTVEAKSLVSLKDILTSTESSLSSQRVSQTPTVNVSSRGQQRVANILGHFGASFNTLSFFSRRNRHSTATQWRWTHAVLKKQNR